MRTKVFWSAATLSAILLGVVSIRTVDAAGVNRADYVKGVTGDTTFTAFKITTLKVRTYGDTAVVIGIATIAAKIKGEDESGDYSFTDVFVKQKGEWKAASGQATPVAKDQATE